MLMVCVAISPSRPQLLGAGLLKQLDCAGAEALAGVFLWRQRTCPAVGGIAVAISQTTRESDRSVHLASSVGSRAVSETGPRGRMLTCPTSPLLPGPSATAKNPTPILKIVLQEGEGLQPVVITETSVLQSTSLRSFSCVGLVLPAWGSFLVSHDSTMPAYFRGSSLRTEPGGQSQNPC